MKLTTSNNIMMTGKYDDTIFYKHQCDCGDSLHQCEIIIEKNCDVNNILTISFYANITAMNYKIKILKNIWNKFYNIWQEIKWRTKSIIGILFYGRISGNEAFIIQGEDSIKDYIKALNEALQWIKLNEELQRIKKYDGKEKS